MPRGHVELDDNDEIMRRCRQVRDELNRRFKTVDALCDHIERREKEARAQRAAARSAPRAALKRPARPAACRAASHAR